MKYVDSFAVSIGRKMSPDPHISQRILNLISFTIIQNLHSVRIHLVYFAKYTGIFLIIVLAVDECLKGIFKES